MATVLDVRVGPHELLPPEAALSPWLWSLVLRASPAHSCVCASVVWGDPMSLVVSLVRGTPRRDSGAPGRIRESRNLGAQNSGVPPVLSLELQVLMGGLPA